LNAGNLVVVSGSDDNNTENDQEPGMSTFKNSHQIKI
jgi:hypothetical protein